VCRLFSVRRCDQCQAGIHAKDLVTKVNDRVYHVDCFICASCGVVLRHGQQFRMRDGLAYCLLHYELLYDHGGYCGSLELEAAQYYSSGGGGVQKGRPRKRKLSSVVEAADMPITMRLPASALGQCCPSFL
jgi:LIM homeobox protein 2/9